MKEVNRTHRINFDIPEVIEDVRLDVVELVNVETFHHDAIDRKTQKTTDPKTTLREACKKLSRETRLGELLYQSGHEKGFIARSTGF